MNLVIFESSNWTRFAPLCLTRPIFALASGSSSLLQRQLHHLRPDRLTLWVRPQFAELCRQRIAPFTGIPTSVNEPLDDQPVVLLNAAALHPTLPESELSVGHHVQRAAFGDAALVFCTAAGLTHADALSNSQRWQEITDIATHDCIQGTASQIADIIHENEHLLALDFARIAADPQYTVLPAGPFHALQWESIRVGRDVKLSPGVVLDASAGPIVIDSAASIGANSVIEGPCFIGSGTYVRPLTIVRGGMTIGPCSKVGGELAESIIQGNSNKVHDGYLGHSFLGEWVNLGAGSTTSNLKNTYGPISLKIGSREQSTGRIFMGSLIGDYTKAAIHTRLMSGTYIGVSSMIATSHHAPRFVGSFAFLTDDKQEPYEFRKAVDVASRVFARRKRPWTGLDESQLIQAKEMAQVVES